MTPIRILPPTLVNQIAAGEVVERPASALKELVENAIDAGATQIDIRLADGGKSYFSVSDNGKGMTRDELILAVERHATSKLPTDNLFDIRFLGFRGEALPSIASVARLKITSRPPEAPEAWSISVAGGAKSEPTPAAHAAGTTVEVRDLFYATPARLKFLKSAPTEQGYIKDMLNRLAMGAPAISFSLSDERRKVLHYPAADSLFKRVAAVIGKSFDENAIAIDTAYEEMRLTGFVGLPTYLRATAAEQYLFVNGRFVRDKVMFGAIRGAFQGLTGHDGHPVLALFLTVPQEAVDVNVHPVKTEVRFQDSGRVRGLLVGAIRTALAEHGHRTSGTIALGAFAKAETHILPPQKPGAARLTERFSAQKSLPPSPHLELSDAYSLRAEATAPQPSPQAEEEFPPLGFAKAQLHTTYIVSQTPDSIIITDQHAAHERLTYERLLAAWQARPSTQILLIPEVIELKPEEIDTLRPRLEELKQFGLVLDIFGQDSVVLRETPSLFNQTDYKALIQDLADTLKEYGDTVVLADRVKDICARMACHGSIRAGRVLTAGEMNALLRQMEACGTSGQCIHGRPTYIELKRNDIERLFGRQ